MATTNQQQQDKGKQKRRVKKNVASGIVHINSTFNNTLITITDINSTFNNTLITIDRKSVV